MRLTIYVEEWLLWVGIGVALLAGALLSVGFFIPEWALWMVGIVLALMGVLIMDLGLWIVIVLSCWVERESRADDRESAISSVTQNGRMFPGI